jgi:hypothetical protein
MRMWAPFVYREGDPDGDVSRTDPRVIEWMARSIGQLRAEFPDLVYTYSFAHELETWKSQDVSMLDILEPHVWMSTTRGGAYNDAAGYGFEKFDPVGFDNLVRNGRREYEQNQASYDEALFEQIDRMADWSRASGLPLFTTECWAIVDYKDWPGLDWDWIMDLTAKGVEHALGTRRWVGVATSNFCGPQFVGMWRDVAWHQRLTSAIHASEPEVTLGERPSRSR